MEEFISDAPAIGKRVTAVYSPEMKLALVREYASDGQGATRAQFARSKGIPPGSFDGWYWKYSGIDRGHAKEGAQRAADGMVLLLEALRRC